MFEAAVAAFSLVATGLVGLLARAIWAAGGLNSLRRHRSDAPGFADLLNYAAVVDDGVVVCKNGAFLAGWVITGADDQNTNDAAREATAAQINAALVRLGAGWMIHVDSVRREAPEYSASNLSHFRDGMCAAIDEERRGHFHSLGAVYENRFVLVVTYFPPLLAEKKFAELMFEDGGSGSERNTTTKDLIENFKDKCQQLESQLSLAVDLERLGGREIQRPDGQIEVYDDLLSWLQFCLTGQDSNILLPKAPIYLDALLGGQDLWSGITPKIGRNFIAVVAIEGFPLESTPGMLNLLAEFPCQYRWSNRFIFLEEHQAVAHLEKLRRKWRQKIRGVLDQVFHTNSSVVNQDALQMVEEAEAAISELSSGAVGYGYYTGNVVLMDEDRGRLEAAAGEVVKLINSLGFVARVEQINAMDAFMGSLPGHGVENVRRPLLNTMNLADLLPANSIWTGAKTAPCPYYPKGSPPLMFCVGDGTTAFRLNLHDGDVGHTIIFGPTGSGKSTLLAILVAQMRRYPDMSIFFFDKGLSVFALAAAIEATGPAGEARHFNVAADNEELAFCPLQFLDSQEDLAWAGEWIEVLTTLNDLQLGPRERNEIQAALRNMKESKTCRLSDFDLVIQNEKIRAAIAQYVGGGTMGHLFDARKDGLKLSKFTVFEIETLLALPEKFSLPTLLYLFRRIEKSLTGQPTAIILDEAWLMLGHPVFREKIREWLKVMRKANCAVVMATQSLSDASRSGILDVISESPATKIFLPNYLAREEDNSALYRRFGLNDGQIEQIASAMPKRDYYFVSAQGQRVFDLALGPAALAIVAVSDRDSITELKVLRKQEPAAWLETWLNRRTHTLVEGAGG